MSILVLVLASLAAAQIGPVYPSYEDFPGLPGVTFQYDNPLLIKALYPDDYRNEYKMQSDIRYTRRHDSLRIAMWDSLGAATMMTLEDLSGINWQEKSISINVLRYLRTDVLYDPPAVPFEGIKGDHYIEAVPTGIHQYLNMIKMLAGRLLLQGDLPGNERVSISGHPLLEKSAYRFEVMVLALTVACAEMIFPPDSLEKIYESNLWKRHNPGWEIFNDHFRYNWPLSSEMPLFAYILREPYDSPLVQLTRPPRLAEPQPDYTADDELVQLSASGGVLGISVNKLSTGLFEIVDIDTTGIAFRDGLMVGDQIRRVNGELARSTRDLMGKILDFLDQGEVYLQVNREGQLIGLYLWPEE